MERQTHWIAVATTLLFGSAIAVLPARALSPDGLIKTQEARLAAPVEGHAVASTSADAVGVLVRGMESARLAQLLGEGSDSLHEWRNSFDGGRAVAVGSALAKRLSLRAGDTITLVAPSKARSASNGPHLKTYKIGAILPNELTGHDAVLVLMTVSEAERYSGR
jgi:lipoprotein-releasing system permease protein